MNEETNLLELVKEKGWNWISQSQKLSEEFITKHKNKLYWSLISQYQKLSEDFMTKYKDKIHWWYISRYQKLSEDFINQHQDKIFWDCISKYQKLSEEFINQHQDKIHWKKVSQYQKLSEEFITHHSIEKPENSWLHVSTKEKLTYLKQLDIYPIVDDTYIEAYKLVRSDYYSVYNFQYQYELGKTYEAHCDCNFFEDNSFGLSAWTKPSALEYHSSGRLLKVRIAIEDIGAIVQDSNKIRCSKLTVLEEILL